MRVLAVNAGSSSLKLSLLEADDRLAAEQEVEGGADHAGALRAFLDQAGDVDAVAHRLVHGGAQVRRATVVDDRVRHLLDDAARLAPLHVPVALELLDVARLAMDAPQVVCVDTAFHVDLPDQATTYAIPARWRQLGVRRYGFHGLSYAWASARSSALLARPEIDLRLLMAHIGSGVSVCASRGGRSLDTSMGFTPLEGAVMARRSGSVDPGALMWLQEGGRVSTREVSDGLERDSGLLALCGWSDVRDVEHHAAAGDARCEAALDVYVHSLARNLGAVAASLDRVDALVFTGGVGEHSALVRSRVCARLGILRIPALLGTNAADAVLSAEAGRPAVIAVRAREDLQMVQETRRLLGAGPGAAAKSARP